jgi:hypothetical protein
MVIHSGLEMMSYLSETPLMELRFLQALKAFVAVIANHGVPLATETAIFEALAAPVEDEQIVVPLMVVAHLASHFITQKSLTLRRGFPKIGI